ncbi:MAG: hypothetical protein OHK0046_06500 [Anaerolineae bacterium]
MAVIYKAVDEALGRTVAIKILRPSLTTDPTFIARFRNEARSIANLAHANIVTVHDVGNDGPTNYIVMEFVEGRDLKKIIKAYGTLSVEKSLHYAIQICAGLGFAHRAGLVHADVKPQNVLVNRDDVVKITDFGIAQALSDTQAQTQRQSVVWGSPHYFAPEQAQGERPSAASDVYSIGIVMFEMLTGRLPYTGTSQQELALAHIRDRIPLVTEFNPNVPEPLAAIVAKVMSKNPHDRYRTADQLGNVLLRYRDSGRAETVQGGNMVFDEEPTNPLPSGPESIAPPPQGLPTVRSSTPPQQQQVPPPPPQPAPYQHRIPQANAPENNALPTQRYSSVPEVPSQYRNNVPSSIPAPADPYAQQRYPASGQQAPQATVQGTGRAGDSRPYAPRYDAPRDDLPVVFDGVTIALAALAFAAVACLIPLYIAVLQALG